MDDDNISVCAYGAPECWWENMEDLTQCAGHEEMLEESAWQADLAEQKARDMLFVLQQSRVVLDRISSGTEALELDRRRCSKTLHTVDKGLQINGDVSTSSLADDHCICVTLTDEEESFLADAIDESILQASFAEQTAEEMKQVMTWWTDCQSPEQSFTNSQKECLPKNSLVVASPDAEERFSPEILFPPTIVQLMTPTILVNNYICSPLQSPYSSSSSCIDKAQEQAIQVDAHLECAENMRQLVMELNKEEDAVEADDSVVHWDTSTIRGDALDDTQLLWGLWTGRIRRWLYHIVVRWVWNLMSLDMQLAWVWLAQRPVVTKWISRVLTLSFFYTLHQIVCSKGTTSNMMNVVDYKLFIKEDLFLSPVRNAMHSWMYHDCSYHGFGEVAMEAILL